ncbi:hypothetical protein C0Q70_18866 [Pomacea canaliculata]|uniref:Uncharacterized protein n=1 Tax=Pomacea canaliculata TaxID=400727 RepID=A0A2T7NHQ2_POMCA|nr:hypothetical protein C0Q70_18866 [Pomacea canaliculata]
MPVLFGDYKQTDTRAATDYEVDALVEQVRERLCLKSREKVNAVRQSPYSQFSSGAVHRRKGVSCVLCTKCRSHRTAPTGRDICVYSGCACSRDPENPNMLLKKLLAEQRLIQEAVRRIQAFRQYGDGQSATCLEPPSPGCDRENSTDSSDCSAFSSTSDL